MLKTIQNFSAIIALSATSLCISSTASAQESESKSATPILQVVKLAHCDADNASGLLHQLARSADISMPGVVADPRTNSLLVQAHNEASLAWLMTTLKMIDVPSPAGGTIESGRPPRSNSRKASPPEPMVQAYKLPPSLQNSPGWVFDLISSNAVYRVDSALNDDGTMVIVHASGEDHATAYKVITELTTAIDRSEAEAEAPPAGVMMRFIWLGAPLDVDAENTFRPVPKDLAGVEKQLARFGITNLGMIGQGLVRTEFGGQVEWNGEWRRGESFAAGVSGSVFHAPDGRANINLEVQAETSRREPSGESVATRGGGPPQSLYHMIDHDQAFTARSTAAVGQYMVIGSGPIGDIESVIVIQLIDPNEDDAM